MTLSDEQYKQLLRDITDALLKPRDQEVLRLTQRLIAVENTKPKDYSAFIVDNKNRLEQINMVVNDLLIRSNGYESRLKQLEAKPEAKPKESNPFYRWFNK